MSSRSAAVSDVEALSAGTAKVSAAMLVEEWSAVTDVATSRVAAAPIRRRAMHRGQRHFRTRARRGPDLPAESACKRCRAAACCGSCCVGQLQSRTGSVRRTNCGSCVVVHFRTAASIGSSKNHGAAKSRVVQRSGGQRTQRGGGARAGGEGGVGRGRNVGHGLRAGQGRGGDQNRAGGGAGSDGAGGGQRQELRHGAVGGGGCQADGDESASGQAPGRQVHRQVDVHGVGCAGGAGLAVRRHACATAQTRSQVTTPTMAACCAGARRQSASVRISSAGSPKQSRQPAAPLTPMAMSGNAFVFQRPARSRPRPRKAAR